MACEKEDSNIIDPTLTFPSILASYLNPLTFNSDTINCVAVAVVSSEEAIQNVQATVTNPSSSQIGIFILKDDGVLPDTTANDGRYTGLIYYITSCRLVGNYQVEFLAQNVSGLFSNTLIQSFQVVRQPNLTPIISNIIIVPDSIQVLQQSFFVFMVTAIDPEGYCDILRVFYEGTNPNGGALTPQNLYDDGSCCIIEGTGVTSGDTTALDSKFTRKFYGSTSITGYYRYNIRAVDRSGDTSNILSDSIYVYP